MVEDKEKEVDVPKASWKYNEPANDHMISISLQEFYTVISG